MKNLILYISLTLLANCLIAQEFIGVAASHKLITPAVKTTSSACPNGNEQTVSDNETFEKELVELINLERASVGAPPVKLVNELTYSSRFHSKDMADQDYFSHNSASGCTTFDRISAFYTYLSAGENIASGFSNPETVHQGFINSPPHYSTMINASYNEVGVGYSYNTQASGQTRWVENFGSRQGI
ncbi:MAG: CAP domain-containing protein, partial [Chitinophagales bacterium]|nr:CAP domain-containing protein [Chitinophagales bacterium]